MISLSILFALFTLAGVILMITAMGGNGSFGSVGINASWRDIMLRRLDLQICKSKND